MKGEIAVNLETLAIPDKNVSVVENDGGIGKAAKNQHLLAVAEEKPGQSRVPSLADLRGRSNSTKLTRATSQMMNVGDLRISCILAFDGGFVIGTSQGKVAIFAPETEVKQTVFKQLRQWSVDYNVMVDNADHTTFAVQNMCLSPTEVCQSRNVHVCHAHTNVSMLRHPTQDNLLLQQGNSR